MNSASVSIWMFWSRSMRSVCRDSRSSRLAMAAHAGRPHRVTARTPRPLRRWRTWTRLSGGKFIQALGVLGLDEKIEAVLAHRSIPSLGSRSQPGRALHGRVELAGKRERQVVVIEQLQVVRTRVQLGLVGDGFGEFELAARAAVIGAARTIGGYRGRRRRYGRDRQAAPVVGAGWRRVGVPPDCEHGRWQDAILKLAST